MGLTRSLLLSSLLDWVIQKIHHYDGILMSAVSLSTISVVSNDGVVVNSAGTRVYVTSEFYNRVSVIDTSNNSVLSTISVDHPREIAINTAGTRVYVTNSMIGNVSVIDTSNNSVVSTIPVGDDPNGVAVFSPPPPPPVVGAIDLNSHAKSVLITRELKTVP